MPFIPPATKATSKASSPAAPEAAPVAKSAAGARAGRKSRAEASTATPPALGASDSESGASQAEDGELKKCWVCKKKRAKNSFKMSLSWCAPDCRRTDERLLSIARQQGEEAWYKDLKKHDPAGWAKLMRDYEAKCPERGPRKKRDFYNMVQFKSEMFAMQGEKSTLRRKRMFERQWLEYAMAVDGGSYTMTEARAEWKKAEANPRIKRDKAGPANQLRLAMPYEDLDDEYVDVGTRQALEGTKTSKNMPKESGMRRRAECVTYVHGTGFDMGGKLFDMVKDNTHKAMQVAASTASESGSAVPMSIMSGGLAIVGDLKVFVKSKDAKDEPADGDEAGPFSFSAVIPVGRKT